MDYTNQPLGRRVQTQIPLNVKTYSQSEATLKNLGVNNNLAFTYEKGLIVYCVLEGTRYEWKEMTIDDVGLLDNNFIYPNNVVTFGIDYSNKEYNFVKVDSAQLLDQNNYVRQLLIDVNDLPDPESYTVDNLIAYILALPESERTIAETDSKWNIIPIFPNEGDPLILEVYELQNKGKGVITTLTRSNLLLITRVKPSWNNVLDINPNINSSVNSEVLQQWTIGSNFGPGTLNGFTIRNTSLSSPTIPVYQVGAGLGNSGIERSLSFYTNRTEFQDGLNNKGLEYKGDYEANFTARSLVTKQYVDNIIDQSVQKVLTYPTDFTGINYTLTSIDENKLIFIVNGSTNVTITVPTGLPNEFFVAIIQEGTGDVTIVESSTIIKSGTTGKKILGQDYQVALDKKGSSNTFWLTGNTKI